MIEARGLARAIAFGRRLGLLGFTGPLARLFDMVLELALRDGLRVHVLARG